MRDLKTFKAFVEKHPWLKKWPDIAAAVICVLFTAAGVIVSVIRFLQFESWYYDYGIFDQAIRSVARFQAPIIDHFVVGGKWIWADHFHPGIFLLSPLYWFTNRGEVILIAQAVIVGVSAYVLYRTCRSVIKDGFLSLAILISYVLFVGLQNAVITDFHEIVLLTLPLMLCYWAILTKRKLWFVIFLILSLSFKETLFTLGLGLSFFVFIYQPEWRKLSFLTGLYSFFWGWLGIKVVIPFFSGGNYEYIPPSTGLMDTLRNLVTPAIKVRTTFYIFESFLFLPLLYLPTLPIILMNLASRYLYPGAATRWDLGLHYNAEIAPTLAISALLMLKVLQPRLPKKIMYVIGALIILNSLILYRFILRGPFALAYNTAFYTHTSSFTYLNEFLTHVPNDTPIMTQNDLAVRFTDRLVLLLRDDYKKYNPALIVLDLRPGQNPNNFYGIGNPDEFFAKLKADPAYEIYYQSGDQYIFKHK